MDIMINNIEYSYILVNENGCAINVNYSENFLGSYYQVQTPYNAKFFYTIEEAKNYQKRHPELQLKKVKMEVF